LALVLPPLELDVGGTHILLALPWLKGVEERKRLVEHIPEMVGGMAGRAGLLVQGREVALEVMLAMVVSVRYVQIPLVALVLAVAVVVVV
jgi:hypothetical protein